MKFRQIIKREHSQQIKIGDRVRLINKIHRYGMLNFEIGHLFIVYSLNKEYISNHSSNDFFISLVGINNGLSFYRTCNFRKVK